MTPPTGAPTNTMRTLDQIEARTPLVHGAPGVSVDSNGTITISESGSYFLTGNLMITEDSAGAIRLAVDLSDVSIDLNGFTIEGPSSSTVPGISAFADRGGANSEIKNGIIIGFNEQIRFTFVGNLKIKNLRMTNAVSHFITLIRAGNFMIQDCSLSFGASQSAIELSNCLSGSVKNIQIQKYSNDGIYLSATESIKVYDNLIIDGQDSDSAALKLENGSNHNQFRNLSISNLDIGTGTQTIGVDINDSHGNLVADCKISHFFRGVETDDSDMTKIVGNQISEIDNTGIFCLGNSKNMSITKNTLQSINGSGIFVSHPINVNVSANMLADIETIGIGATTGSGYFVSNNLLQDVATSLSPLSYAFAFAATSTVVLTGNRVVNASNFLSPTNPNILDGNLVTVTTSGSISSDASPLSNVFFNP